MPEVLTERQREILDYLRKMLREKAYPPTVREIGLAIGLSSSSTVQNHLNTLERKGYIQRDPSKSRAIEMIEKDPLAAPTSSACRSSARWPRARRCWPSSNIEDRVEMAGGLFGEDSFLLRVRGDSMIDDGHHGRRPGGRQARP